MVRECEAAAIVAGLEIGAQGTPHIQGAVIWNNQKTFRAAQKALCVDGRCATMKMKGLWSHQAYCKKEGEVIRDDPYEDGPGQGRRTDIVGLRDAVLRKRTNHELNLEFPNECCKYARYINWTRAAAAEADVEDLPLGNKQLGIWMWGPSNTGKTQFVKREYPGFYWKPHNRWWDAYENQKVVFIDDPTELWSGALWNYLKLWVQESAFRAQQCVGGEQRMIRFEKLIVCSNYSPEEYFGNCYVDSIFRSRFVVKKITGKLY